MNVLHCQITNVLVKVIKSETTEELLFGGIMSGIPPDTWQPTTVALETT